jgi:hypothetical protein
VTALRLRGLAGAAALPSLALVSLPLSDRNGVQRTNALSVLDPSVLDRFPDGPLGHFELGSRFLHQHVVTLHTAQDTDSSSRLIDYTPGALRLEPWYNSPVDWRVY